MPWKFSLANQSIMFLTNIIYRKLSSLLQPWLQDEPELELKLGFIKSHAILKNLTLNSLCINQLLDEESSNSLCVKEVKVKELILRFSHWSSTAFSFEIRGLHVTLSAREIKKERLRKDGKSSNLLSEDVKRSLSAIDPEGGILHDVLERILSTSPSRNRIRTSILNLILNHCHLQIPSISVQLQLPFVDDSFAYILEVKDLNTESLYFQQGCLLRGLVGALFRPLKEIYFVISARYFEIGYKRNDHANTVCSSNELYTFIKLDELLLVDFHIRASVLSLFFSPVDLNAFVYLGNLTSKDSKRARNGRLLWKLASRKIGLAISAPNLSLHNLVSLVSLWLCYVNSYENLLILLGYSADHLLKRSAVKMSQDKMFIASVKNSWEVISDIEKELPPEAIAQARRIARYKAASNVQHAEDSYRESFVINHFKIFCKILPLLASIWKVMYKIFHLIVRFLVLFRFFIQQSNVNPRMVSEHSCPHYCFILNLESITLTVYPENLGDPVNKRVESQTGISSSDFLSFCLSVDSLILMYIEDISEKSVSVSCGQLKVKSSTNIRAPIGKSSSKNFIASEKGHRKGKVSTVKSIMWGEPAQMFFLSETNKTNPAVHAEAAFDPLLENFLGEMWMNWKRSCMKFEENEIEYSENPWLLCEIKSFLTFPGHKSPDSGFWKCNLTMGKLNIVLGDSSILSLALLLRQIQHAVCWTKGNGRSKKISGSPPTVADRPGISCNDAYESYASGLKMGLLRILPEKHIQIGVLVAGPHIQISSGKVGFHDRRKYLNHLGDFHLEFDVHNIEVVVWPTTKSDLASFTRFPGSDDAESECIRLCEPQLIDIPKSDDEKYASEGWISLCAYLRFNGLNAYLVDSVEKQHNQILSLKPITFQLASFREYAHSLTSNVVAFSVALCGMATGFTIMSFVDEMYVFLQVVVSSFTSASYALNSFDSVAYFPFQEFMGQDMVSLEHKNKETTGNSAPLICTSILISLNGTFKLKSSDLFFHNSRMNNKLSYRKILDASNHKRLVDGFLDYGFWISVHPTCIDISCEEGKMEVFFDLSGVKSLMVRYEDHIGKSFDRLVLGNLLVQPHDCLHELSLSNCMFTLLLNRPHATSSLGTVRDAIRSFSSVDNIVHSVENSPLKGECEKSIVWSNRFVQKLGFTPSTFTPAPSHWILVNIAFDEVFMTSCSVKNGLIGIHQINKLLSSLSVGGEFQTASWTIQGGLLFLEMSTLQMFVHCLSSYVDQTANLLSILQLSAEHFQSTEDVVDRIGPCMDFIKESAQGTLTSQRTRRELLEAFVVDVSQFSVVLVIENESGCVRELVLEIDAHMELGITNLQKKFKFELSCLSILSQFLQEGVENELQIPHFSSVTTNELLSGSVVGEGTTAQYNDRNHPCDAASCSKVSVFENEFATENCASQVFHLSHQNHILKHLGAFILVEKVENNWFGRGSVSGFDMTVSLSELQMILSTISSFSEAFSRKMASETTKRLHSNNQEAYNSLKTVVPDGAIVAIQDVHQHTYFAVERGENKYTLVGALHYSLVGERALFRVKYQIQRRWKSSVLWFSLISLHAKNDSGEPLRLNYRSGSCFVDISSADDSKWALWRTLSCDSESYSGDVDWEPCNQLVKDTFYLVNKKNECAVAFIDGAPEFVRKPGNPFKFKLFDHLSMTRYSVVSDGYSPDASGTNLYHIERDDEGKTSGKSGSLPCIDIAVDKISLTIVHELLDTKDRLPLLCGCISDTQLTVQILPTKARVINTSRALLSYFDGQRSLWRELVQPVEVCVYYRSSSEIQGSENFSHKVPLHIYCRTEINIFLTELSLDILLFAIGKLNLAGPYIIRSSRIFTNCCKVENQSGLNLQCLFYNQQSVIVGRKQSASIFLRHSTLANQPPDISSVVSIQLFALGSITTSSINLSLLEAQSFAWRTRIMSAQDSRTYPGPFLVVDISRKSEDGLSIVVSPLIRIHNETGFSMELRFRRTQENEDQFASVLLKPGEAIDDSMAMFDAINLSGGLKKALTSLSVGNFLFSFRPENPDSLMSSKSVLSAEWSDELKGGKAVHLSGIFDKLSYEVRKALAVESEKYSFSTAHCALKSDDVHVSNMHFLIESIRRNVPIIDPHKYGDRVENRNLPTALQEQKEIFLLPTMQVSNLLHLEIQVLLTETDLSSISSSGNIGKQATIPCGSTADFYVNPAIMYFTVTLTAFKSKCKPVNSSDWVKKLVKHKNEVHCLDIDLDFGGGKYFASLRLSRGQRGILEAVIFSAYTIKNETDVSLFLYAPTQKPLSRCEVEKFGFIIPPEMGLSLAPKLTASWLLRSHKVRFKLFEDHSSEVLLDLDALSGLTEINLEVEERSGVKHISRFGVSMGPSSSKVLVPSQTATIVPRHVVVNETEHTIIVQQCYLEDDMAGMFHISSKQRTTLQLRDGVNKKREFSLFENIIRKHRNGNDKSMVFIQFRLAESELGWSGPLCISSLGRFFLKFRKQSGQVTEPDNNVTEFASVHVAEEGSTLVVHFHRPPIANLPYRIENCLNCASITYYQKDSSEPEVLGSGCSVDYVWDDLTLPHKLVVLINDTHTLREINLDKVRPWKPFYKVKQHRGLASHLLVGKKMGDRIASFGELNGIEMRKVGYEICADGPTRVLRICEFSNDHRGDRLSQFCAKIQLRISHFAIHLLEHRKQDLDEVDATFYTPILVARLANINLDSIFTDRQKYNQISVQSLNVEHKWVGAPYAAMIRRHELDNSDSNECVLKIVCVLLSTGSNVQQVKYSSIVLQPVDLNLDEETLMRIVSFWRTSVADSNTKSRQFYFDHFEIHPIKIIANFLPGDSYSSYNSAQETLRSLLHSVVKVPSIRNIVVELNGILVTHALITARELFSKCAQHYLWYVMRSIYIAKGSPLLPPAFSSIFDDLASSSLDVFFDPSHGLMNLPGFTLGTFKFISKCIYGKDFSGTKRYFGDLGKTLRTAGSNVLFAAIAEISDSVLKGAETSGFDGLVSGFHQGLLKLAMEPSLLGTALMGGGPDRNIKLDRTPGIDELYIEGYLQAMLDTMYRQEYLRVRVIDNQVFLKNLPPNNTLIDEIMDRVKGFLESKALLKGNPSKTSQSLRHLRGESEWKIGPTVLTLCEHLFVSFAIRLLRRQADKLISSIKWNKGTKADDLKAIVPAQQSAKGENYMKFIWKWGFGKFVFSGIIAYIDGRLCRGIPNPVARRIVGGFLLSFLDRSENQ